MHLPWNWYHDGPVKLSMATMAAIALAVIAVGNNDGNSGGGGSSVSSGGYKDKNIRGYSIGGGHEQQSTISGGGRNMAVETATAK
jgi:hypothetical protein